MNAEEFNQKYQQFLDPGHYGLDIDVPEIVEYLDNLFPSLANKFPLMKFQQIKLKFDMARVYMLNVDITVLNEMEKKIDELFQKYLTDEN